MEKLVPIIISIIGLFVTIIAQREKLLSFFDELKKRIAENNERKRALAVVGKFANLDAKQPSLVSIYIPILLISIISSAAISYLGFQSNFYNTILLSTGVYLSISMIVLITFLATYKRFELRFILALFVGALTVSAMWGIVVIVVEKLGLRMMWSGIVAGIIVVLWLWLDEFRSTQKSKKRDLQKKSSR